MTKVEYYLREILGELYDIRTSKHYGSANRDVYLAEIDRRFYVSYEMKKKKDEKWEKKPVPPPPRKRGRPKKIVVKE